MTPKQEDLIKAISSISSKSVKKKRKKEQKHKKKKEKRRKMKQLEADTPTEFGVTNEQKSPVSVPFCFLVFCVKQFLW
jgi:hypothetical protein